MSKPDWKDAPEWAHWLAIDDDGEATWFEFQPLLFVGLSRFYVEHSGRSSIAEVGTGDFGSTEPGKEPRP